MHDWQTPISLLVVLTAFAYIGRLYWKNKQSPGSGCGKGCGCPVSKPKSKS